MRDVARYPQIGFLGQIVPRKALILRDVHDVRTSLDDVLLAYEQHASESPAFFAYHPSHVSRLDNREAVVSALTSAQPEQRLRNLLDECTLIVRGAARYLPEIAILEAAVYSQFQRSGFGNLFSSNGASSPFPRHSDTYPVFAFQLAGAKEWWIYDCDKVVVHEVTHPGDLIYIPKGTAHAAATAEVSVHFSVSLT